MRIAAGIFALLVAWYAGRWLRERPSMRMLAWSLIGFAPFYGRLDFALFSFGDRPGDTHGFEFALVDGLAIALAVAERTPVRPMPYRMVTGLYLFATLLAATQAPWTLGALAYAWKTARMIFLFWVLCRASHDRRVPAALLRGMMLGLAYDAGFAIWQRLARGEVRAHGIFAHQNTLGMLIDLLVMVPIALLVAGPSRPLAKLVPLLAFPACIFTISRGTLLFFGAGAVAVYLVSAWRSCDLRKATIGLLGVALAAVLVPLALVTLESRSRFEQEESLRLRWQYESAASSMLRDHPLGVGPNHFTVMLLTGGYGDRAAIDWSQRVAIVHNVYWATAAEMGWLGLGSLLLLFGAPLVSVMRSGFGPIGDRRGDVLLGLTVGLLVLYAHSLFEWAWRTTEIQYVYWMVIALVAALSRQIREEGRLRLAVARRRAAGVFRAGGAVAFARSQVRGAP